MENQAQSKPSSPLPNQVTNQVTSQVTNEPAPLLSEEEALRIREENYEKSLRWSEFQSKILAYSAANRIPYKASFELTPRCSLKCKMCLMRLDPCDMKAQGQELSTEEWIRMGQMAFEAGTMDLLLTGGEPMLRKDFKEIYTAFSDMGFILRVFSNATLVTDEILALFAERPPQSMEISLYGASRETYQLVGGWAEGYDRMVAGLDALRAVVPSIRLKTTIIRDNANDFEAMKAFAKARALPLSTCTLPQPAIRGARADVHTCRLNLQELLAFHQKHQLDIVNDSCEAPDPENRGSLFCQAGLASYAILWHGAMVACMTDDDPDAVKGHPLTEGFDASWARLAGFRCGKALPEPCKKCPIYPACSTCVVHHRAESGAYEKQARYVCDFNRITHGLPLTDV